MRTLNSLSLRLLLTLALFAGVASAETSHTVEPADMQAAITARIGDQAAQRAAIQSLLARPEVEKLAADSGLDLARAKAVASHLEGEELGRLAEQAMTAEAQLASGGSTIVISATVLLLLLILIVLLVA